MPDQSVLPSFMYVKCFQACFRCLHVSNLHSLSQFVNKIAFRLFLFLLSDSMKVSMAWRSKYQPIDCSNDKYSMQTVFIRTLYWSHMSTGVSCGKFRIVFMIFHILANELFKEPLLPWWPSSICNPLIVNYLTLTW